MDHPIAARILGAVGITVALAAWVPQAPPAKPRPTPTPDGRPTRLERASESSCNECHAEIVSEWASTLHAMAWEDELYQADLVGRKKAESCHGCHAPLPLHATSFEAKPQARPDARHFGVSCESCHLAPDGALLGPTGVVTDKHPTRRAESLSGAGSNALCSACHRTTVGPVIGIAKDFEHSELPAQGKSCVECHMSVVRTVERDGVKREVRSHELQTPRDPSFLASAFSWKLLEADGRTKALLTNLAGHRVPGLIGREIEFRARALDAAGKEIAKATLVLDTSSYLPLGESLELELGASCAKVEIAGWVSDLRLAEPRRFVELTLAP